MGISGPAPVSARQAMVAHINDADVASFSILALRQAEALQKWKEITQSVDTNYRDQIKAHFGINTPANMSHMARISEVLHVILISLKLLIIIFKEMVKLLFMVKVLVPVMVRCGILLVLVIVL